MRYRSIISLMPKTPSVDPDAQAFLTASGITDTTISGAINTLVVQMKADNIWTKMKAIYPMVGGTASTHKWNLKDPRDLDAAFRLQFFGGWTHSANGALPNGTNAYANTFLNQNSLTNTNQHISTYLTLDSTTLTGCSIGISTSETFLLVRFNGVYYNVNDSNYVANLNANKGFYVASRISNSSRNGYRNANLMTSVATAANANANLNFFLGAANNAGSPSFYDNNNTAFASIGQGLTDTEVANFYTALQVFQTTLNRQV